MTTKLSPTKKFIGKNIAPIISSVYSSFGRDLHQEVINKKAKEMMEKELIKNKAEKSMQKRIKDKEEFLKQLKGGKKKVKSKKLKKLKFKK